MLELKSGAVVAAFFLIQQTVQVTGIRQPSSIISLGKQKGCDRQ
ncbi:hypothetical protein [Metabacillus sediminilitoris]|nr:hypothetical protein [Metabacillus sediminilitoris]